MVKAEMMFTPRCPYGNDHYHYHYRIITNEINILAGKCSLKPYYFIDRDYGRTGEMECLTMIRILKIVSA